MSSKFIKNSRIVNRPKVTVNDSEDIWYSMGTSVYDREEKKRRNDYNKKMESEKLRIESIPLEQLSFKDIYTEPFIDLMRMNRVYSGNNFIFQFLAGSEDTKNNCLKILNGELTEYNRHNVIYSNGEVVVDGNTFILIRGWGNLTGTGGYNLDEEYARKIQDTLGEFIVEKLGFGK